MLREQQLRAFSMAEERALFGRMVAQDADSHEIAVNPAETVEIFASKEGLDQP